MNNSNTGITPEFIWANLTDYQQQIIGLRYEISKLIDSRPINITKVEMFEKVGRQVSLTCDRVKMIYYTTKK